MNKFDWRHQYEDATDELEGDAAIIEPKGPSLTQQRFKDDADLNVVLKRMGIGNVPLPTPRDATFYAGTETDYGEGIDLREALDRSRAAREHFDALPASLRKRFRNDPQYLHDFVMDEANKDESVKLGLLKKTTPAVPPPVISTDPVIPPTV
jgi:hypothetical protein